MDYVQIKSGARLTNDGDYQGTIKTDTVTLKSVGMTVGLKDIENVRGSVGDDYVTLSGDLEQEFWCSSILAMATTPCIWASPKPTV